MYILKLSPSFKDYLWGGTNLRDKYGMNCDYEKIAEAWVLSCHKDGASFVTNGEYKGKTLIDAINKMGRACLGTNCDEFDSFPLLVKLIDAKQNLSVQVHPDDAYALKNEGEFGKTEMWYIVDCDEGAGLYHGFKKNYTKEEVKKGIENNTLTDMLNFVKVKKGDCFLIEAGTVHAIGAGILIAEIQQNSNSTYRVYDFGRVGADGKPRELHINKALDVMKICPPEICENTQKGVDGDLLSSCKYFTVEKVLVNGEFSTFANEKSFLSILCTDGKISVNSIELFAGECVFIPASFGNVAVAGNGTALTIRV